MATFSKAPIKFSSMELITIENGLNLLEKDYREDIFCVKRKIIRDLNKYWKKYVEK